MQIRKPQNTFSGDGNNHEDVLKDIYKALRRNISYGGPTQTGLQADNINGAFGTTANTGAADTEFSVTHNLNRVPVGFHVINQSKAGSFYGTPTLGTHWSKTQIFLKCNVANVAATFFIF